MSLMYTHVAWGGAVKSLENGHIGGYLVTFGSPSQTDLEGEFFTPETDFDMRDGTKTAVYFNHRVPLRTRTGGQVHITEKIGEGTLRKDSRGVLIDAILYNRAEYEQALGKMGWSSGTASHLVDDEPQRGKTWIKRWPLGLDASITPAPAEPRNAVMSLKSFAQRALATRPQMTDQAADLVANIVELKQQRARLGLPSYGGDISRYELLACKMIGIHQHQLWQFVDMVIARKEQR